MRLMEYINSIDFALRSHVDNVELIVYSSRQLSADSASEFFLHFLNYSTRLMHFLGELLQKTMMYQKFMAVF